MASEEHVSDHIVTKTEKTYTIKDPLISGLEEPHNSDGSLQQSESNGSDNTVSSHDPCGQINQPLSVGRPRILDDFAESEFPFLGENVASSSTSSSGQCCLENYDSFQDEPLSMSDTSKDNALQNTLITIGLKQKDIEFIFENGDKFLEKPTLLAKKLKIELDAAKSAIEAYKYSKQESTVTGISQDVINKIVQCMSENPEFDSAEDIAILCDVDESLVAVYLESTPLTDAQKTAIKEKLNTGYAINDIANILKLSLSKVQDFVGKAFLTFDGKEGQIILEIIKKNFPEINCSKLREMIISKNLKLQDQLCYILQKRNNDEYLVLRKYIERFEESNSFFKIFGLTIEDIILIKQSSFHTIEELSIKLNKVESVIRDFLDQYHPSPVVSKHFTDLQKEHLSQIRNDFAKTSITFHTYRMIISNSFKEIIDKVEQTKQIPMAVFNELLPLAFYYLKCSLPLDDITQIIANNITSKTLLTTHDLFHLLFQLSEPMLRGYCIENYSFSNPIPLYYPNLGGQFEICKELWYSMQEFNGLVSFGLGRAGWNSMGKSYLLDFIFGTDFVRGNPQKSAFHLNSIDLQMTKNLFVEKDKKSTESTKWAYIDCHGHSKLGIIQFICQHLDVAVIHVSYHDYRTNRKLLAEDLSYFRKHVKYVYCLIRDYDGVEVKIELFDSGKYFLIPNLTKQDTNIHSVKKDLIEIGREILHLKYDNPKYIGSDFLEKIIGQLDPVSLKEINHDKKVLQTITNHIKVKFQSSHTIDFSFLSYYPLFVEYMSHYYRSSYALDQKIVDHHNDQCTKFARQLNDTKIGEIVKHFNNLLQKKNSTLILWKLSQDLSLFSQQVNQKTALANPERDFEQKNDKYTLEILWREAFLSYNFGDLTRSEGNYVQMFASNFSNHVGRGEPFELIDGDNLRFFNKEIDALLFELYDKQNIELAKLNEGVRSPIKQAPIVVSIIGPQSSGKSTLLNYCFGCKFLTSAGRCTRGIYGSLSRLSRSVNNSNYFLILDTEGLDAIERGNIKDTSLIHFDRTMVLFCLAVSQVVIINVKGDIGTEMHNLLQVCAYSMNRLKVTKVPAPKIFFVLNQQADPDPDKHLDSFNILIKKLNEDSELMETGVKVSDLIKISKDNLFILPSAFNSEQINRNLFESKINKLSPTITFADKCADLRLAIIGQLKNTKVEEKSPFETMNEWMDMSGTIWDTIVRYQDIVKYRNVEEEICSNKLRGIVHEIMEKNIYCYQQTFLDLTETLTEDIQQIEILCNPNTILTNFMVRFDEVFERYQNRCLTEFETRCQGDSLLKKMNHICSESNSNLSRLIYMERKVYEDKLKFQIKAVLTEIKLSESMKKFQELIVNNVDKYLSLEVEEQKIPFEDTWCKCFDCDDQKEEEIERDETFNNLFSIFMMESKTMEKRSYVYDIFRSLNFNMGDTIESIQLDILTRFQSVRKEKLEQFIFPISENNIPIKHMTPYQGKADFEYIGKDSLFTVEMERRMLVFSKVKLKTSEWVPNECRPLIKYCSGYYNHPDITWKKLNKNAQILLLASKLKALNDSEVSTWKKLINNICKEIRIFVEQDPNISPGTVKEMVHYLCSLFKIVNYEISFIEAKLSNTAERTISILMFAYAFKSLWNAKRNKPLENKANTEVKKQELLQYFLQRIENRKMVRGTWDYQKMKESDHNISNNFAQDFIRAVKRGMKTAEQPFIERIFEERKESLSHEKIFFSANSILIKQLSDNPEEEIMDENNFVVQYICNRNETLMGIFLEKWDAIVEDEIYHEIAKNIMIKVMNQIRTVINVLNELQDAIEGKGSKLTSTERNAFDSDSNFELVDMESCKSNGADFLIKAKEIPFKSVVLYLRMYLDPRVSPEEFNNFFTNNFSIDGVRVKASDTYVLCDKPMNPAYILDTDTFKRLENTEMFNSENIFNIYEYLTIFISVLQGFKYNLTLGEFREMIKQIKENFKKNALGCPSQCPSCGKLCERELHPNDGKCQIKTGHQICSMGGKVWNNDEKRTAVLFMCDSYKDDTRVCLPGQNINWGKFKIQCGKDWDWNLPDEEKYAVLQQENQEKMRNIWNKFGKGILNYYSTRDIKITYVRYDDLTKFLSTIEFYICFVIDGTSSMLTELKKARDSVEQFVNMYMDHASQLQLRVVIYRDHCDDIILEKFPCDNLFTPQYRNIQRFLETVKAYGGGDYPEAVLDGLATAASESGWKDSSEVRNIIIHIFDAPPHGNFPDYESHDSNSNPKHCCCCNHGTLCSFDWNRDVWDKFKKFKIQYYGINTGKHFPEFEEEMKEKLEDQCGRFQSVGKEVVNNAILQIFINHQV